MSRAASSRPASGLLLTVLAVVLGACDTNRPTSTNAGAVASVVTSTPLPDIVRQLAAKRGVVPLGRPTPVRPELVRLGQALLFDKILSGNRNIACSTCHLAAFATSDGKSLAVGQGGSGLGPGRTPAPRGVFIPRNSPELFNLFALDKLFWDGRVSVDTHRYHTPAGVQLTRRMTQSFEFGALSAQPMFPVTSRSEMRGNPGDAGNELAEIPDADFQRIWAALMRRLGQIPEYPKMFEAAYPGTRFSSMTFAHASNAMAGFMVDRLTFNNSPWDRFLAGDDRAMTDRQLLGAQQFLTLKCSICHNGATFSDGQFHDVALAQLGPGEGDGTTGHDDFGRMRVTGNPDDRYRFRTTPLRNVELIAPYGHDGAIVDLRAFVDHYSQSDVKLMTYDPGQLEPLLRGTVLDTRAAILAQRDTLLRGVVIPSNIVDLLTAYMRALTDPAARNLSALVPARVPSGLPVDRDR